MRRWTLTAVVCLGMVPWAAAIAQNAAPAANPAQPSKTELPREYRVPLLAEPLKLSDFAGMKPRPELKDKLLQITGFVQRAPRDGEPATEETEVWLGYTKTTFYLVFICHDHHPEQIRGHLARRENILNDDNVWVLFDPFQDRRKGVLFQVNPAGVQADAAWSDEVNTDYSYDQIWDSDGQITPGGWMALMAIPFRSLRFRSFGSDWGVVFRRNFPRNSEGDFWPRVAANVAGTLSQEGTLKGIEGVTGSRNLQINPYSIAQNVRTLDTIDPLNPYISSRHLEGTAGGEFKAILKDRIVFDATVNPDFSNIESDQPQFTVNQRYAVYFPELRPFFLENANYFSTPIDLVYTRNIVHPEYGARLTGKVGRTNIGLFAIDDREPGQTVAPGDPLFNKRAKYLVGRISQDIGKGSSIGAIYADQEFGRGWNRIGGVDFKWRMTDRWSTYGQWVESSTKGTADSGTPPTYSAGPANYLELRRSGHAFNLDLTYQDFSNGFETQLGFIQTSNVRNAQTYAAYAWFPKHRTVQSYGIEASQNLAYDHQGNRVYRYLSYDAYVTLPRNVVLVPIFGQNSDTMGPPSYSALTGYKNFTENFGGFVARGAPFPQLNFRLNFFRSGNVNYNPLDGRAPSLLDQETAEANFTLQPFRQLTADNVYLLDRDRAVSNGAFVYESQTFRTKVNYQFTRALSARVIVQYDSTLANPAETSLKRTRQVGTEALFTWLPHPGTAIYIGYNNDMQNLDRAFCNRLPGGACDPDNTDPPRGPHMLNDGRQIFIKASYLFRF